jgi:nucleoside-diphosphate-sugar epimerase
VTLFRAEYSKLGSACHLRARPRSVETLGSKEHFIVTLITGATGFVGRNLTQELLRAGHEVHILARPRSTPLPPAVQGAQVHWYSNYDELFSAVGKSKPQVVYHLASLFLAEHKYANIEALCNAQITLGTHLADAMVNNGVKRLVSAGTSWQNFNGQKGVSACLYAATKEAFESILRYYADAHGLKSTVLKLFDTYGPGDTRRKLLSLLRDTWRSAEGKSTGKTSVQPLGLSPGDQKIDLLHVHDAVRAFTLAGARSPEKPCVEEFYLSTGRPLSLRELVKLCDNVLEKPIPVTFSSLPYRAREVMTPWNEGPLLPNWKPEIHLEQGLKSYFTESVPTEPTQPKGTHV